MEETLNATEVAKTEEASDEVIVVDEAGKAEVATVEQAESILVTGEAVGTAMPQDPIFINTPSATVCVYGHDLLSKRYLELLAECLTLEEFDVTKGERDHGVRVVIFRDDNRPKEDGRPLMANCCPDAGAISINLLQTFTTAMEEALDTPEFSIVALFHRCMMLNFLHEIVHMERLSNVGVPDDPEKREEEEKLASEWAYDKLVELAKTIDVEAPHPSESPFLAAQLLEMLPDDGSDKIVKQQRFMVENGITYMLPEDGDDPELKFHTFKEVIRVMTGWNEEDTSWDAETILPAGQEAPIASTIRELQHSVVPADIDDAAIEAAVGNALEIPEIDADPNLGNFGAVFTPAEPNPNTPMFTAPTNPAAPAVAAPTVAPQAAVATQVTPQVANLPNNGLSQEQVVAIMQEVYMKLYLHIMNNCERLMDSAIGFQKPENVHLQAVPLNDQEKSVVFKMDCLDENGRWCPGASTANGVRGQIMKQTRLPAYKIYFNLGGREYCRLLLPQNPDKRHSNGELKETALQARAGSAMMYIMEGNDAVKQAGGKLFHGKIIDGVYTKA